MEGVELQPSFEMFRPSKLHVPNRLEFVKGFPFEFEMAKRSVQEMGSFAEGSKDPTT
jgi:hypothetical protein